MQTLHSNIAVVDIEALRFHRCNATTTNWLKDVRAELARIIYKDEIYPKNLYMNKQPPQHDEYKKEVIDKQIQKMIDKGIWLPPS